MKVLDEVMGFSLFRTIIFSYETVVNGLLKKTSFPASSSYTLTMRYRVCVFVAFLLTCFAMVSSPTSSALARTPSAVVIEVGDTEQQDILAACKGIQVQDSEIFISKHIGEQVRRSIPPEAHVHLEAQLTQSEDIDRIVLLRSKDQCDIFLAAKSLPPMNAILGQKVDEDISWKIDKGNAGLYLYVGNWAFIVRSRSESALIKNSTLHMHSNAVIWIYNEGRLPLWESNKERKAGEKSDEP